MIDGEKFDELSCEFVNRFCRDDYEEYFENEALERINKKEEEKPKEEPKETIKEQLTFKDINDLTTRATKSTKSKKNKSTKPKEEPEEENDKIKLDELINDDEFNNFLTMKKK
jgi:hypothetical protein